MPFTLFWTKTTGRGTLMNIRRVRQENQLLINLVFRLLPVQALIVAMGSINSLVDGVAARTVLFSAPSPGSCQCCSFGRISRAMRSVYGERKDR